MAIGHVHSLNQRTFNCPRSAQIKILINEFWAEFRIVMFLKSWKLFNFYHSQIFTL